MNVTRNFGRLLIALMVAVALPRADAGRRGGLFDGLPGGEHSASSFKIASAGDLEVAFSPNEGADELEIRVIRSGAHPGGEIRMLAYGFNSASETRALLDAKSAGADIKLVVDEKENTVADRKGRARAALSALVNAGIDVRVTDVYASHHDKVTIVDRSTTEVGSFNYTDAAKFTNSENVLVNWGNPKLAAVYRTHFDRNYAQARPLARPY